MNVLVFSDEAWLSHHDKSARAPGVSWRGACLGWTGPRMRSRSLWMNLLPTLTIMISRQRRPSNCLSS